MKRYFMYMIDTLRNHGVKIENDRPTLVGPINPLIPGAVKDGLKLAARGAYMGGGGQCAPQLICVVLPGRSAPLSLEERRADLDLCAGTLFCTSRSSESRSWTSRVSCVGLDRRRVS